MRTLSKNNGVQMKRFAMITTIVLLVCSNGITRGDVKLPAIFGDHMVLQGGMKVPIWGTADAGEKVTVKTAGQEKSASADENGKWRIELDALQSDDAIEVVVTGNNSVTFKDVLVGEVWVCSGQSNMGFSLKSAANAQEALKSADRPNIRLFMVGRNYPDQPQEELTGKWEICTPDTAGGFSAVAYFFAVDIQQKLNQPMGLIQPSWGGTRAEAWMPKPTFDALELPYEPEWTEQWLHPKTAKGAAQPEKARPHQVPAGLYNGMIAPIAGYAMRGVIWYQGETNTAYGEHYRDVLGALITSWRDAWGQGDFPFLVVQLANLQNTRFWPTLRAGQAQVAKELPNVGLTVTIDVGESKDIHPKDKQTVGQRLALSALKIAYNQDVPHSGSVYKSMKIEDGKAVITFDHVYDGLMSKGGDLQGFEIAGEDGKFVTAEAAIDGQRVIVRADGVTSPHAVRYAWANDPTCTLYNKAGLPAVPFEATK